MFGSEYHFVTHWRVEGTPEEVYRIIDEPVELVRWWPAVYLDVEKKLTERGEEYVLLTRGWLPYTLRWQFRRTEKIPFERMALEAWGDFVGRGEWTFRADGPMVEIVYDWRVRADKQLLRYLSFLLRPIFAANHRWAMARGEESLKLELARQRARTEEERAVVPAPPGPSRLTSAGLAVGAGLMVGLTALLAWLLRALA
jgi:hypothetical protein